MNALRARRGFATINTPRCPKYTPQRMRRMAMDSDLLRLEIASLLKITIILFLWCTGINYKLQYYAQF